MCEEVSRKEVLETKPRNKEALLSACNMWLRVNIISLEILFITSWARRKTEEHGGSREISG